MKRSHRRTVERHRYKAQIQSMIYHQTAASQWPSSFSFFSPALCRLPCVYIYMQPCHATPLYSLEISLIRRKCVQSSSTAPTHTHQAIYIEKRVDIGSTRGSYAYKRCRCVEFSSVCMHQNKLFSTP